MSQDLLQTIKDLEAKIHELEKDLIHDSLTSLKTRQFFEEELGVYMASIARIDGSKRKEWFSFKNLSLLFIDADHFKNINDTYGHSAGDVVLKELSQLINTSVREGDTVARWGGEEIVVSLLGANERDAKAKAEEIRKTVESFVFPEYPDLKITVSIGVVSTDTEVEIGDLVARADKALYKAKESGRNKVIAYSELV